MKISDKNHTTALLLGIFLGFLGIHRFYVGKTGTGVLWLLSGGILGLGWFVDVVFLLTGCFDDWDGALVLSEKAQKRAREQGYEAGPLAEILCWIAIAVMAVFFVCEVLTLIGVEFLPDSAIADTFRVESLWVYISGLLYAAVFGWALSSKL